MGDYCNSVPLYALRGIEYFICIVREVSSKEILCFIFNRVVSPCWVFFLFAESRSLSTMRGPLWDSIGGGGAGWGVGAESNGLHLRLGM